MVEWEPGNQLTNLFPVDMKYETDETPTTLAPFLPQPRRHLTGNRIICKPVNKRVTRDVYPVSTRYNQSINNNRSTDHIQGHSPIMC